MIYINPYDTNYGKLLDITNIKKELIRFEILRKNDNLNYEIPNGENHKYLFITGKDQDEIDLPVWTQPLVFQNIEKENVIAVDLRKYVKKDVDLNLLNSVKDRNNFDYLILESLIIGDFIEGNYGIFNNIIKNITLGFSTVIANIINSIVSLDPVEKTNVEIIAAIYANMLFVEGDGRDYIDGILARVSKTKFTIPISHKYIEKLVNIPELDLYASTYVGLVNNIKIILDVKSSLIDETILLNAISNIWYGHGNGESVMIATEHIPTWITLLYTSLNNKSYKKTRLTMLLEKNKRNIKPDDVIKYIELYLKDKFYTEYK